MRRTLAQLKATAKGDALLKRKVPDWEAILEDWEKTQSSAPEAPE